MSDDNLQRDIGRLEGRSEALEKHIGILAKRQEDYEAATNLRLDKLDTKLDTVISTLGMLNERASKWKIPTAIILGLGTVSVALIEYLARKVSGFIWGG